MTTPRILVAGIGNVFFGDDGFGSALVERLQKRAFPVGVRVSDFGIRGVHLAYELAAGWDAAVILDIATRGGEPGTLYVIEPDLPRAEPRPIEPHHLDPLSVLALVPALGKMPKLIRLVACEPERIDEEGAEGLSPAVSAALD